MKKIILFALALFLFTVSVHAQTITTIAGCSDTALGDGGPATDAGLYAPYCVALDGAGNFYITDGYNNRIRKVNAEGIITTIVGTGVQGYNGDGISANAAQVYRPVGITFDQSGNLYFADAFNNRVRKIDTAGIITTVAGNGNSLYNGDNILADSAAVHDPHAVALGANGNIYITDFENHRIRKVNTSGIITTIAGTGTSGYTGDNGPATAAEIDGPYGIIVDDIGSIYFADYYENVVRKIDTSGIITTFAGGGPAGADIGDNGPADSAQLNGPAGLAIDAIGNIYIADVNYMRIRMVAALSGIITTVAGNGVLGYSGDGGPATNAELGTPTGVTVDHDGNLYIADLNNYRIRYVTSVLQVSQVSNANEGLYIYPDPCYGTFTVYISSANQENATITITNIFGEKVKELLALTNTPINIYLDKPIGTYIVTAVTNHGTFCRTASILK